MLVMKDNPVGRKLKSVLHQVDEGKIRMRKFKNVLHQGYERQKGSVQTQNVLQKIHPLYVYQLKIMIFDWKFITIQRFFLLFFTIIG